MEAFQPPFKAGALDGRWIPGRDGLFALAGRPFRRTSRGAIEPLYWLNGLLSALLDGAPACLVFFQTAGGDPKQLMGPLSTSLVAISLGAVYMSAFTYVGNAPNFMIYAIARRAGVPMPSFFGYLAWSLAILLPVFLLVTVLFLSAERRRGQYQEAVSRSATWRRQTSNGANPRP